jgi:sec-independent protein translocase protein TatA
MPGIGVTELLILGILAVILFGSRLPSVARSLGKSLTEFKKGVREFEDEMKSSIYSEPPSRVAYDKPAAKAHDEHQPSDAPSSDAETASATANPPAAETHAQ